MNLNFSMQLIVVMAIVCICALYLLGKIVPRWRKNVALHLQQARYPVWINALGVRLSGDSGCGSCDTCGTCAPKDKAAAKQS
jgi:hypothetical protein